jgi:hypothetical protein
MYVLEAGQACGHPPGAEFDIYDENALSVISRPLCSLTIDTVDEARSFLASPDAATSSIIPARFYALPTCLTSEQKIKFYVSDPARFCCITSEIIYAFHR